MDIYRQNFLKAQKIAENIVMLNRNQFLSQRAGSIRLDGYSYVPAVSDWYRLGGFRMKSGEEPARQAAKEAVYEWIRSSEAHGNSLAFVIAARDGNLDVFYGSGRSDGAEMFFKRALPECEGTYTGWEGAAYPYNGLLLGTITSEHSSDVIASAGIQDFYAACISIPVPEEDIPERIAENESILSYLNDYKSFRRTYGNASKRVEEVQIPAVVRAISILKEENEYLAENMAGGFARCAVRFGASDAHKYQRLKSLLISCMNRTGESSRGFEPARCFDIEGRHAGWRECLAIPCIELDGGRQYLTTGQTAQGAAGFCTPPIHSYKGFYVKNYRVDENAAEDFPLTRQEVSPGVSIGKVKNAGWEAAVPYRAILAHAFVCGAPNNGKTTTVKRILKELNDQGIPFTVIEAAKKEYIGLMPQVPELKIYTPGTDGLKLMINPLQPEEGVLIENQVDAVVRAVVASHGGEHPIPEALEGLLKQTYEKAGWEYGMMAYHDKNHPFPVFADALKNIPEYIERHARYGPEVRKNLQAALTLRTENLASGALGRMVNHAFGMTAKDILACPSVIELADFSSGAAEFLTNILMFQLHSYLARLPEEHSLKRVIVVEEAHNVFRRTWNEESGRALNNQYFEKMLAEIRSSGTGMILCDQRPSIMSEAVMANTAVKIAHSLGAAEDRELIGKAMGLSEFQTEKIREFSVGECIIGIGGTYGVQHAQIRKLQEAGANNAACHICCSRFRCRREAVCNLIHGMDREKVTYHLAKIQSNPYNVKKLAANIERMLLDLNVIASAGTKVCLLGEILRQYGNLSFQDGRVIVNAYSEYVRRGA
ncbi:MAG: DUF853 family protein [Eubacteriales bacterium]|nr:DUF853 family protein [Eubacteriales bacterium]